MQRTCPGADAYVVNRGLFRTACAGGSPSLGWGRHGPCSGWSHKYGQPEGEASFDLRIKPLLSQVEQDSGLRTEPVTGCLRPADHDEAVAAAVAQTGLVFQASNSRVYPVWKMANGGYGPGGGIAWRRCMGVTGEYQPIAERVAAMPWPRSESGVATNSAAMDSASARAEAAAAMSPARCSTRAFLHKSLPSSSL